MCELRDEGDSNQERVYTKQRERRRGDTQAPWVRPTPPRRLSGKTGSLSNLRLPFNCVTINQVTQRDVMSRSSLVRADFPIEDNMTTGTVVIITVIVVSFEAGTSVEDDDDGAAARSNEITLCCFCFFLFFFFLWKTNICLAG